MTTESPFRIKVADLLRRPGTSRAVEIAAPLADLAGPGAEVPRQTPIAVDLTFERISEGVVVRGTVEAPWEAVCSRCLTPLNGTVSVHVDELFEPTPLEGETYPIDVDVIDLEPLVRDALVLELPAAPVCREECAGLCANCGADRNVDACDCRTEDLDPRWAALRSLDL